jgi:iron complex outermembrane receptor protein
MSLKKIGIGFCRNGISAMLLSIGASYLSAQTAQPNQPATGADQSSTSGTPSAQSSSGKEQPVELPAFDVTEDAGRKGYESTLIGGASRMVVPIDQMDGSAFVINSTMLDDLQPRYLTDALKYVSGVAADPIYYSPWDYDSVRAGVPATNLIDGMPVGGDSGQNYTPMDFVEQLEVIKGSQGVMYGVVSGTGIINHVMKQPLFMSGGEIEAGVGPWGYIHSVVDVYNSIPDTNDQLAFRFINVFGEGGGRQSNLGTDLPENDHYAALRWKIPGGGSVTVDLQYDARTYNASTENTSGDLAATGLFDPNISKQYEYYDDITDSKDESGRITIEKKIGPVENRLAYQYLYSQWDDNALFPFLPLVNGYGPIWARYRDNKFDVRDLDYDGVVRFDFGNDISNIVNFGYELEVTDAFNDQLQNYGPNFDYGFAGQYSDPIAPTPINLLDPNISLVTDNSESDITNSGYINWRMSFFKDRLSLIGGYRYEEYNEVLANLLTNTSLPAKQGDTNLYRWGVVGNIVPGVNAYVGYSKTFNINTAFGYVPTGSQFQSSSYLPNQSHDTYEGGFHISLFDGKLTFQPAYYEVSNTGNTGPGSSSFIPIVLLPNNTDKGFELQITATPMPNLTFVGSVTAAQINNADGTRTQNIANNLANFWTKYTFTDGGLKGFGVGVGVVYTGDKVPGAVPSGPLGSVPNYMIPAVTTMDASISYMLSKHWFFQVNAENVFDKLYVTSFTGSYFGVFYNDGRKLTFSTKYKW